MTLALAGAGALAVGPDRADAKMAAPHSRTNIGGQVSTSDLTSMAHALRTIGTPVCLRAADRLGSQNGSVTEFDLHLRNAGLDAGAAELLARGMDQTTRGAGPELRSFSASYNPGLSDAGAIRLCRALPGSVTELGLVGCDLGDTSGLEVLDWASRAPSLRMICVEGNGFSVQIRSRLRDLSASNPNLFVVV